MIAENLKKVREQLNQTAVRCGRNPEDIRIVAVSKKHPAAAIKEAIEAGHFLFGENYIQEASQKIQELGSSCNFHFIGHLQSNKAKTACSLFQMVETVDRLKTAQALNKHCLNLNRSLKVLIQVNCGLDPNKSGVLPDSAEKLFTEINKLSALSVHGLMTMPPFSQSAEKSRTHFRSLRLMAGDFQKKGLFDPSVPVELSMGMSQDFQIAIEEGATLIRIGTAIFGPRTY